jgi:class 3 adenylate cyclase
VVFPRVYSFLSFFLSFCLSYRYIFRSFCLSYRYIFLSVFLSYRYIFLSFCLSYRYIYFFLSVVRTGRVFFLLRTLVGYGVCKSMYANLHLSRANNHQIVQKLRDVATTLRNEQENFPRLLQTVFPSNMCDVLHKQDDMSDDVDVVGTTSEISFAAEESSAGPKEARTTIGDMDFNACRASIIHIELLGVSEYNGLVRPKDLSKLIKEVASLVRETVEENHGVCVRRFGGHLMAAVGIPRGGDAKDRILGETGGEFWHIRQSLFIIIAIQKALFKYNIKSGINLSLSIGMEHGFVHGGVLGRRFSFDVWGNAVTVSEKLARSASNEISDFTSVKVTQSTIHYLTCNNGSIAEGQFPLYQAVAGGMLAVDDGESLPFFFIRPVDRTNGNIITDMDASPFKTHLHHHHHPSCAHIQGPLRLSHFDFLLELGGGSFGQVFLTREKVTKIHYAFKVIKKVWYRYPTYP